MTADTASTPVDPRPEPYAPAPVQHRWTWVEMLVSSLIGLVAALVLSVEAIALAKEGATIVGTARTAKDLDAAIAWARASKLPIVLWGSSYSASLSLRLASESAMSPTSWRGPWSWAFGSSAGCSSSRFT